MRRVAGGGSLARPSSPAAHEGAEVQGSLWSAQTSGPVQRSQQQPCLPCLHKAISMTCCITVQRGPQQVGGPSIPHSREVGTWNLCSWVGFFTQAPGQVFRQPMRLPLWNAGRKRLPNCVTVPPHRTAPHPRPNTKSCHVCTTTAQPAWSLLRYYLFFDAVTHPVKVAVYSRAFATSHS